MNRAIFLMFVCVSSLSYGQIENKWQPDSVYVNHKVKKIFIYLNSPKDLSEIMEFDKTGKKLRSTKYSASYNRKTRKLKTIDLVNLYKYDSSDRLTQIVDSIGANKITFHYDTKGKLILSKKYKGLSDKPSSETKYSYDPFKSTTTRRNDSIILYQKTKEYDKGFYMKRFYGFYLDPKLKKITSTVDGITNTVAYSDKTDLQRFEDNKTIKNSFDSKWRLIKSDIKSVFMIDRINEFELNYKYYKNGLLRSIRGYVPRYFEYEYWE